MTRPLLPWSSWRLAAAAALLAGCTVSSDPPGKVQPAPQAAPAADAVAADPAAPSAPTPGAGDEPAPALTEEELALIAADPKDLTVEMRRKRAYARRKQIMQNPDSPTARALSDLAAAHQAGEVDIAPKGDGPWLHPRGTKPTSGRPPAGWRPSDGEAEPAADAAAPAADAAPSASDGAVAP
ncbi:MAG: hypothetical protein AB1Z98_32925 [Nannocystaceae bacterium]